MTNHVYIDLVGSDGEMLHHSETTNVVTTVGKKFVLAQLNATGSSKIKWIRYGTGSTAPAVGDIGLTATQSQAGTGRTVLGAPTIDSTYGKTTFVHTCSTTSSWDGATFSEAGLYYATGTDNTTAMYAHCTFSTVVKESDQKLIMTWVLTWNP